MVDRGTVTNSTLQMGLALAGMLAGLGVTFLLTGTGVLWVMRSKEEGPAPTDPSTCPSRSRFPTRFPPSSSNGKRRRQPLVDLLPDRTPAVAESRRHRVQGPWQLPVQSD